VCNDLALLKEAEERARGALALFESSRDVIGQGKALLTLGYALDGLGQIPAALTAMEEALVVLETHGPSGELSHAYFNAGFNALFYSGRAGEGLTFAEKALQVAEACGEQSRIAKALDLRGLARTELGDPLGVEDVRESLRLALLLGDPNTIAHLYGNLADGIWLIDGPRPSLDLLTEGLEFAQSRGQVRWVSWLKADALEGAFELGLWADVLQQADDLMEWERRHEFPVIRCTAMEAKTRVLIETEGTQQAATLITPLLSLATDLVDLQDLVPSLAIAAMAYAKLHEHAASQKLIKEFEQKTGDAANYRARYLPEVVRILVAVDEVEWADRLIPQTTPPLPRNQHAAVTATAIVAEARGEHARALALHQDAADRWKRYGFVLEEGQALFGAGRCLLALGGNVESHKSLQEAREIFARLGARPLIEEIDNCLRQGKAVGS
jgi:tetratricopeptide (TPR) repeat protein